MKVSVILPAAGLGTRMARPQPEKAGTSRKQFMLLDNLPILAHTVRKFVACPLITEIVVSLRPEDMQWGTDLLKAEAAMKPVRFVEGGDSRQHSVENALASLPPDTDLVAVHDAVRPFVDVDTIERVINEARQTGAAIVGIVPVDTVKLVHLHKIRQTLTRERLILTQTPQVFRYDLIREAFDKAREDGFIGTDESSLVERLERVEVSVVAGSERNIKITRPNDMELARLFHDLEIAERKAS
jgi:2-C-methyl-D-erythritol 4-phosphate cytidylyltransferase